MSRYITPYASNGQSKWTTLLTSGSSVSTETIARRITVMTGTVPHFMAFGTSTVAATTASLLVPANSCLDFNMTVGTYVAFLSASGSSYVSVIDSD